MSLTRQVATLQDTSVSVMTCRSRHVVVAPFLAAPLLTDVRRSTVGSGTREDIAARTTSYEFWVVPEEHPIVLTRYMLQFMLETFNGPGMYVAIQAAPCTPRPTEST